MSKAEPTQQRLIELFDYNSETGEFTRCGDGSRADACIIKQGYRLVSVDGRQYRAQRLAWIYVYGGEAPDEIDHKDLDKGNNRITNLRAADRGQNSANRPRMANNVSGFKCVRKDPRNGRYTARICVNRKRRYIGFYDTPEQAHAAYVEAAIQAFGEYARAA